MNRYQKHSAFTLVELSIVLVILGLIAGGVLSGQSLIRAAEIRGITTDYSRFAAASNSFRDKYFSMPGDMSNATQFWGFAGTTASPNCISNSGIAAVSTPGTCDGNGDGVLSYPVAASATGEAFLAWQHLSRAGLVEGIYTGNAGTVSSADPDLGLNSPASKIRSVGWGYGYVDNASGGNNYLFNYDLRNWLVLGNEADNMYADGPALKNEEAWNIDTKLDDGKPGTGNVLATALVSGCAGNPGATTRTASYDLTSTAQACGMVFKLF